MESSFIWHKPTEAIPANVEVIIIYKEKNCYSLNNFTYIFKEEHKDFAGFPIIAWAECNVRRTAEMMMENFDIQWIDFLNKNATT